MKQRFTQITLALLLAGVFAGTAEETNAPAAPPVFAEPVMAGTNAPASTNVLEAGGVTNLISSTNALAVSNVVSTATGEVAHITLSTETSDRPVIPANGFDLRSFRIIYERNIFNPNRYDGSGARTITRRETERRPAARSESFALVGTMSYEKGSYAFFDGSSSQFRKVIQPDDIIAGFKVTSVTPKSVTLEHEGKTIELCVGMQMRKSEDEQDWKMQERSETYASSGSASSSSTASSSSGAGSDEVMRRLMAQREQESGGGVTEATNPPPTIEIPPPPPNDQPEPAPTAEEAEILRRLQQRREQENQR